MEVFLLAELYLHLATLSLQALMILHTVAAAEDQELIRLVMISAFSNFLPTAVKNYMLHILVAAAMNSLIV